MLQVHLGSYKGVLMGLKGNPLDMSTFYAYETNIVNFINQYFINLQGTIKCLKLIKNVLISGGYDEILRIYNTHTKKEVG